MNAASLKQSKWVRRGILALAVLLVLWLVGWLAVPPIAKNQLQKIASEKLGRQVTVGKIDFKPWTLELTVDDLAVAGADGAPPQLQVARLYADAELQSILRLAPVVDALRIESPTIRLRHLADGKYDIEDMLAKLASAPSDPKAEAPKFAIYNIAISNGAVDFEDQPVGAKHQLREFALNLPFLSNLPSQREVKVEPKLAFVLNGSRFDSAALATPFAETRQADAHISFKKLDLAPYLGYIPGGLPVKLLAATLDADLHIDFVQAKTTGLKISGSVEVHDARIADGKGRDLLAFGALKLGLADVRPLENKVHLSELSVSAPQFKVAREASGKLNLLTTDPATGATEKKALPADGAGAAAQKASEKPALQIQVDKIALQGGQIGWHDETTQPTAVIEAKQLDVEVTGVTWPTDKPASLKGSATVAGASLKFNGEATDKIAKLQAELDGLPLSLAAPYLAQSLEPTLDGKLSGALEVAWNRPDLKIKAQRIALDALALSQGMTSLASVGRFELVDAEVDMTRHTLAIGSVSANNPKVLVERGSDKRWMFERWFKAPAGAAAPDAASAQKAKPWELSIGTLDVIGGAVSYSDKAGDTSVAFELSDLNLNAQKLAPGSATASPVLLAGRLGAGGRVEPGRFGFKGDVALKPLAAEGRLELAAIPAHAFKAYYSEGLNIDVRRAFASYKGTVRYATAPAGAAIALAGDTALEDVRVQSVALTRTEDESSQLLRWKVLNLRGLQVDLVPKAAPVINVKETALTDFYARVIIDPTGRINLQNVVKPKPGAAPAAGTPDAAAAPAAAQAEVTTTRAAPAGARTTTSNAPVVQTAESATAPLVNFGPMSLVNGKIEFTDLFVKPNYSADLSELTGKLSAFSSKPKEGQPALAELELRGKAQQTAALEITGKLNPLAKPLELDVTAKLRDLDLAPLSTYSIRHAGHGIERGKLNFDVNYKIAPDGRLTATNKLVLNQLQFGEQVQGAPASLPVRLAVALLADRNGVIDVDLPLSGSINDPQFRIGPLIWQAIGNLIVKAVTAPFSLLAGGLGGGSGESSVVAFDAGSSAITPANRESLDKVAKALTDRPALRMTVVGLANLDKERDGFKRERLRQMAFAEKRRVAARAGKDAAEIAPLTDAEYPDLLTAAYKRSEIKKPRNMIGLAKDLPVGEMEALLMADIAVDDEAIRELALDRGAAVRDYLLAQKVPSERLFLGAVRTGAGDANWKPGAELDLAMK